MAGLDVLFTSSFVAYLPSLVPTAMLTTANATWASSSAAGVLGPAMAGALISIVGAPAAIATDGVSFIASVVALPSVRTVERSTAPTPQEYASVEAMRQGWEALLREPRLRAFAATAFTANFLYRVVMSVYVLYLTPILACQPRRLASSFGFGGGVGAPHWFGAGSTGCGCVRGGRSMIAGSYIHAWRSTRCSQKTRTDLRYFGMRRRPPHVERSASCLISADGAKYVRALSTDSTKGGRPAHRLIQLAMSAPVRWSPSTKKLRLSYDADIGLGGELAGVVPVPRMPLVPVQDGLDIHDNRRLVLSM